MTNFDDLAATLLLSAEPESDDFTDREPPLDGEAEIVDMLDGMSPAVHAVHSRIMRSMPPLDGSKRVIQIVLNEHDIKLGTLALTDTMKILQLQSTSPLRLDHVVEKGEASRVLARVASILERSDLAFVVRTEPLTGAAARLVDCTIDLVELTSLDLKTALETRFPGFEIPTSTLSWHVGQPLDLLDAILFKSASVSDAVAFLPAIGNEAARTPERLGLQNLHGYGLAGKWAERLVADVNAYREGRLAWSDVDAGVLLTGAPGTGKTELCRRVAGAAGLPLISTSYAAWQSSGSGHLGDVLKALRRSFDEAAAKAPAILFIDELDVIPARGTQDQNDSWFWAITNALLECVDGTARRDGIVVMAACNHAGRIDPALTRPGRFNRVIRVEMPNAADLSKILEFKLGGAVPADDMLPLAQVLAGFSSGADATKIAMAARREARIADREVTLEDVERVALPHQDRTNAEVRQIAVHEAGHVLASLVGGKVPAFVSLMRVGETEASVRYEVDRPAIVLESRLRSDMVRMLAGRAAEEVIFGQPSAGSGGSADSDLANCTRVAVMMEGMFGLGTTLLYDTSPDQRAVERRLQAAYAEALALVMRRQAVLEALVELLIATRSLSAVQLRAFAEDHDLMPVHEPACPAV